MTKTHPNNRHTLLCFAHRGEAKAFLQEFKVKPLNEEGDFYQIESADEDSLSLLITGEGRDNTLIKLTWAITFLRERFSPQDLQVLNLGVCGHMQEHPEEFRKEEVIYIGTCYGQKGFDNTEMEFKSFTCSPQEQHLFSQADIVSTNERIVDPHKARHFSHFAPLVDREAWAIGLVCGQLKCSFNSLKVISDFADGDICVRVKDTTDRWSDLLLSAFYSWQGQESSSSTQDNLWPELTENLHITVSQERRLTQLLKALNLKGKSKEEIIDQTHLKEIFQKDIRPKDKTKEFLEGLSDLLNPLEKKLKVELNQVTDQMQRAGLTVRFDQGHESEVLHLSTSLESEAQVNKIITALEGFDFNKFRMLMRGGELKDATGAEDV